MHGPYTYREYQSNKNIVYKDLDNDIDKESLKSVFMDNSQELEFVKDDVNNIDKPMYFTNQALFKRWYKLNVE